MKSMPKFFGQINNIVKHIQEQKSESEEANWEKVLLKEKNSWQKNRLAANGKRILIATSTGGHQAVTPVESLLGVALTLRGAQVHFLLCDKVLPACLQVTTTSFKDQNEFPQFGPQKSICDTCFGHGMAMYKPLGLPIHLYSQFITQKEQEEIYSLVEEVNLTKVKNFRLDGLAIGEHVLAGALRYFAKANIDDEPFGGKVLKLYLHAAFITVYVMKRLIKKYNFDCLVFHHGIYIPQGIVGEVARKEGLSVVNWNPAYRKKCFIFSHTDTYHHTLMEEAVKSWESIKWNKKLEKKTLNYLKSRWKGTQDWIWFHEKPTFTLSKITTEFGIDLEKPCIGMLTNVMWDAQLHYPANAFPNMLDWIIKTIRYFIGKPQLQLIIRVHPAEIRGTLPSRQKVVDQIQKVFPKLPKNIIVIPPESQVSTYVVMAACNAALIYGTKTGVELTSIGIPVIVAGEAWIRNKGITMDAESQSHYFKLLDKLPFRKRMDKDNVLRARKYAFHFFFRRMIPIGAIEPKTGWPPYQLSVKTLSQLTEGKDPGLDIICEGILNRKEFIYKAEEYE